VGWEWVAAAAVVADHGAGLVGLAPQVTGDRGGGAGVDQEVHLNQTANTKIAQKGLTISLQTPLYPVRFARGRSGALGREGAALL
jgi:hypothetical protein